MNFWTVHVRNGREPIAVPEAFSWGALILGPIWLLAHRAWIAAILSLLAYLLILRFAPASWRPPLVIGVAVLLGLSGNDIRRWSLGLGGWLLAGVAIGRNEEAALGGFLTQRPDMLGRLLPQAPQTA